MARIIRENKSGRKLAQAQIDRAVARADKEIGIRESGIGSREVMPSAPSRESRVSSERATLSSARGSLAISDIESRTSNSTPRSAVPTPNPQLPTPTSGGLPVAPLHPVPMTPAPERISLQEYTARLQQGWVPVMGLPGTPITAGFVRDLGEYNPKLEGVNGIWTYQEMRRGDGQVAGTLRACKMPILSAKWEIVPGDFSDECPVTSDKQAGSSPVTRHASLVSSTGEGRATEAKAKEVAQFIRGNLFSGLEWQDHRGSWHTQSWKEVVRYALRMQDFGAACVEEVMTIDGDRIRLRRLCDRQALTFYRWHTDPAVIDPSLPPGVYDDGETLYALEQWGYRSNRFENVLLPADKACIFTHEQEGANYWGIPLTRAMYPHWFVKKHLERIDAIACERNSLGVPMIMLPPNPSRQDVQTAQNWVTQLAAHEKTGLSLPNGAEFKLVGIEGRIREILPSIQYHKQQIATACLAMFMELGQTQTGSRALGESQTDFFMLATQHTAEYIAHQIRSGTVRRLVTWNFGPDAPVPYLVPANVQARSIESMAAIINQLAQAGAWVSDRASVNQARHELGFEDYEEEIGSSADRAIGSSEGH